MNLSQRMRACFMVCLLTLSQTQALIAQDAPGPVTVTAPQVLTVSSSAQASDVQNVFNQAASIGQGSVTIALPAGLTLGVGQQLRMPCGKVPISVTGPPGAVAQVTFSSGISNGAMISVAPCSNQTSFTFIHYKGNMPAGGGGGAFYVSPGVNNLAITHSQFEGNQSNMNTAHIYDSFIWLDGGQNPVANNITITDNTFGAPGNCGAVMSSFHYQGANFDAAGGYCAAVGIHVATQGLNLSRNNIDNQEQGFKFFEGDWHPGHQWFQTNDTICNNTFSHIHRIAVEGQQTPVSGNTFCNNVFLNQTNPSYGSWLLSWPQGGPTLITGNLLIANTVPSGYTPGCIEFWGTGAIALGNKCQGLMSNGVTWGYSGGGGWAVRNNQFCGPRMSGNQGITNEEHQNNPPAQSGNTWTPTCSQEKTQTVNFGANPAALTLASNTNNATVYFTIDGSTPTFGSYVYSGPINATGRTVKAFAMWGTPNQPQSYPAGYGYSPSDVASSTFPGTPVQNPLPPSTGTGGGTVIVTPTTPVPVSAWLSGANNLNTIAVGGTIQFSVYANMSDGSQSVLQPATGITWATTDPTVMTVNTVGLVTAVGAGKANVQAKLPSGIFSAVWGVTVTSSAPSFPIPPQGPGTYVVTVGPDGKITVTIQGVTISLPQ